MLFQSQINQYKAYTDRYLAFKVEYRKMVPYVKPQISIRVCFEKAAEAFRKFGEEFSKLSYQFISVNNHTNELKLAIDYLKVKEDEHQKFLLQAQSYLSPADWKKYAWLINRIDPEHYGIFLNLMLYGDFNVETSINILPELKKICSDYNWSSPQFLYYRHDILKLENKIKSLKLVDSSAEQK